MEATPTEIKCAPVAGPPVQKPLEPHVAGALSYTSTTIVVLALLAGALKLIVQFLPPPLAAVQSGDVEDQFPCATAVGFDGVLLPVHE